MSKVKIAAQKNIKVSKYPKETSFTNKYSNLLQLQIRLPTVWQSQQAHLPQRPSFELVTLTLSHQNYKQEFRRFISVNKLAKSVCKQIKLKIKDQIKKMTILEQEQEQHNYSEDKDYEGQQQEYSCTQEQVSRQIDQQDFKLGQNKKQEKHLILPQYSHEAYWPDQKSNFVDLNFKDYSKVKENKIFQKEKNTKSPNSLHELNMRIHSRIVDQKITFYSQQQDWFSPLQQHFQEISSIHQSQCEPYVASLHLEEDTKFCHTQNTNYSTKAFFNPISESQTNIKVSHQPDRISRNQNRKYFRLFNKSSSPQNFLKSSNKTPKNQKNANKGFDHAQKHDNLNKESNQKCIQTKKSNKIPDKSKTCLNSREQISSDGIKQKSPQMIKPKSRSRSRQTEDRFFNRLYKQNTASLNQRYNKEIKSCVNLKQLQGITIVEESKQHYQQKYWQLTGQKKSQIFNKLHASSTQSWLNHYKSSKTIEEEHSYGKCDFSVFRPQTLEKRQDHNKFSNYSNEIENVINQSSKRNQNLTQMQNHRQYNKITRKPNMQSRVYSPKMQKRCNSHCEQFQHCRKIKCEKQKSRLRQQKIKQQRKKRQNSRQLLQIGRSASSKVIRSGQCQCCHRERVQMRQKNKILMQSEKRRSKLRTARLKQSKYSIEKKLPPYNASFVENVLEQSYLELFPAVEIK